MIELYEDTPPTEEEITAVSGKLTYTLGFLITYDRAGRIWGCSSSSDQMMLAEAELVNGSNTAANLTLFHPTKATDESFYVWVRTGEVLPKGRSPTPDGYTFNYTEGEWQFDLEKAKAECWFRIKQLRDAEELGCFVWAGNELCCSAESTRRIQTAFMLAMTDDQAKINWTTLKNDEITLTASDILEVAEALASHVAVVFDKGKRLREQLFEARTEEEINEVQWQ